MQARPRLMRLATRNAVAATQEKAMSQTGGVTGPDDDRTGTMVLYQVAVDTAQEPAMIPQQIQPCRRVPGLTGAV